LAYLFLVGWFSDVERPIPELAPYILGFTVLTVFIVYVMLDVEYPRAGLIRLESADQLLVNLRESIK